VAVEKKNSFATQTRDIATGGVYYESPIGAHEHLSTAECKKIEPVESRPQRGFTIDMHSIFLLFAISEESDRYPMR
jgi:hypothetical protein